MRAVLCKHWGPPENLVIAEIDTPQPEAGQIRVHVRACGVNFADTMMIQGTYQEKPALPFSPGLEVAGTVSALGPGVSAFAIGDRVIAVCAFGGFAEEVVVSTIGVVSIPDGIDYPQAAAMPVSYGTADLGLNHRVHLSAGEFLLVNGASGSVGLAAIRIGKNNGARVIAVASTEDRRNLAREHGADFLIDYRTQSVRDQVHEITGDHGVNVVFDPVGGTAFDQAMRCIAWEGRILTMGFSSGEIPTIAAGRVLVKNISVVGLYWATYLYHSPHMLTNSLSNLFRAQKSGKIQPHISQTMVLEHAADALRALIDRKTKGKVVLVVGQDD